MDSTLSNGRLPNNDVVMVMDSTLMYHNNNAASHTLNTNHAENNGMGSPSNFEFHKGAGERGGLILPSLIRPTLLSGHKFGPSKWDDAEKWVASKPKQTQTQTQTPPPPTPTPTPTPPSSTITLSRSKQGLARCNSDYYLAQCGSGGIMFHHGVVNMASSCRVDLHDHDHDHDHGHHHGHEHEHDISSRDMVPSSNIFAFPSPPARQDGDGDGDGDGDDDDVASFDFFPVPEDSTYNGAVLKEVGIVSHESSHVDDPFLKPVKSLPWDRASSYGIPPSALLSVSMRDMGTEMTPIASQDPSLTATPIQATTPTMNSPVSSASSTPPRDGISSRKASEEDNTRHQSNPVDMFPEIDIPHCGNEGLAMDDDARDKNDNLELKSGKLDTSDHLNHHYLQHDQLLNSATGRFKQDGNANNDDDDSHESSSKLLKNLDLEEVKRSVLETRAIAWEEAEQAKYMARFKREEAKIQAWENHQKAKAEAEMRRIEAKLERIRCVAQEKMMNKIALTKRKGEERRAAAEARREEQGAKTSEYAQHIRRTGRMPSFLGCAFGAY